MSKGAYYFPFFYQRFLTSVTGWKDDEVGAYLKLLIYQFDKGSLPNNMKLLSKISPSVKKNWPLLSEKFPESDDGSLQNIVMADIRNEIIGKQIVNQKNGKKGGRPKKANGFINETETKPNGFENENPSETERVTEMKAIPITNNQYPNNKEIYKESFDWNWDDEKRKFMEDTEWMSKTYTQLQIPVPDLKWLMDFFVKEIEVKENYKPQKEIKSHFVAWFRKTNPNIYELRKSNTGHESNAPKETARERADRISRESVTGVQ